MNIKIIAHTPDPELTIARCASTCYDSQPKELISARKMIKALITAGHESCIEHASVTFEVDGISRVVTHELVRHRIASFSQRSQRYVDESTPSYVIPDEIKNDSNALTLYQSAMNNAWEIYHKLQQMGYKNQISRYVLPNACTTKICFTINFRSLRNFLKLRLSIRAQPEIREMAKQMLELLIELSPSCFEDLTIEENLQNT